MTPMRTLIALMLIALSGVTVACSSNSPKADPGPPFDTENQAVIACMKHQPQPPGPRYTDDTIRQTGDTLALLRYYTTNGTKQFCDGSAPTETDRSWARLYVHFGADRRNVASILDG